MKFENEHYAVLLHEDQTEQFLAEEEIKKARENVVDSLMKEGKLDLGGSEDIKETLKDLKDVIKDEKEEKAPKDPYKEGSGTDRDG